MSIEIEDLDGGIVKVSLGGRLDFAGTEAVDQAFADMTSSRHQPVIVDLSGVEFLASIGMRTLLSNAKALKGHGCRMVLLNPRPNVAEALATAGIDLLIPMFDDLGEARRAVVQPA